MALSYRVCSLWPGHTQALGTHWESSSAGRNMLATPPCSDPPPQSLRPTDRPGLGSSHLLFFGGELLIPPDQGEWELGFFFRDQIDKQADRQADKQVSAVSALKQPVTCRPLNGKGC